MQRSEFAAQYDDIIRAPRMHQLYCDSGYFNVGYWDLAPADLIQACDRMVDVLARTIPAEPRVILDVGCGVGAGAARLAAAYPAALLVGGNLSFWQLGEARRRGMRAAVVMDATQLPVASGSVDTVLAIESPQHFDTRDRFLAEAYRVLRPGGTLAMADMLFKDREPIGSWMLPPANQIETPAEYAGRLSAAGFQEVEVKDVTDLTWRPFCGAMKAVFRGDEVQVEAYEESLAYYVIATASKA